MFVHICIYLVGFINIYKLSYNGGTTLYQLRFQAIHNVDEQWVKKSDALKFSKRIWTFAVLQQKKQETWIVGTVSMSIQCLSFHMVLAVKLERRMGSDLPGGRQVVPIVGVLIKTS